VWVRVSRFQLPAGDRENVLEQFNYVVDESASNPVFVKSTSGYTLAAERR
jgi:hypothetical protein